VGRLKKLRDAIRKHLAFPDRVPAPWAWICYVMCKDVYHCTPSQLKAERLADVMRDLNCRTVECENADLQHQIAERDNRG